MIQVILLKGSKNDPIKFQASFICRLTERIIPITHYRASLMPHPSFLPPHEIRCLSQCSGSCDDQPTDRPADRRPCQSAASEATAASNNNERESWLRNKYEMPNFATGNAKKPGRGTAQVALLRWPYPDFSPTLAIGHSHFES